MLHCIGKGERNDSETESVKKLPRRWNGGGNDDSDYVSFFFYNGYSSNA